MRRRFFVEKFEKDRAIVHGETAEHLGRVLRAEAGQLYELSDGKSVWLSRIETIVSSKRGESRIEFSLVEPIVVRTQRLSLHLLISLIKFDRFEWCLEKATELGAAEIVPVAAARSDKPLIEAAEKRRVRWTKILVESAQQARLLGPPALADTVRSTAAFARMQTEAKILLSERADALPLHEILRPGAKFVDAALAFGPEGGWTTQEIEAARGAGFAEASLGETILRAETAVIAAASVVRFAVG